VGVQLRNAALGWGFGPLNELGPAWVTKAYETAAVGGAAGNCIGPSARKGRGLRMTERPL